MKKLVVYGAKKLIGMQKIHGSKNSCLPIMVATLLANGETTLKNCPILSDSIATCKILNFLGCSTQIEKDAIVVNSKNMNKTKIPKELMTKLRSSIIFLGAILARCNQATVCFPGGCEIGKRPIDFHLKALQQMGTQIKLENEMLVCKVKNKRLNGAKIRLAFPSVGATENILLAASTANGTTTIENAAIEPEIVDLCNFLIKCGAQIHGYGTKTITIYGVEKLNPTCHRIMADRIVAATILCAVAATKGEVFLKSINPRIIASILPIFKQMNCTIYGFDDGIFLKSSRNLKTNFTIKTMPYPGFPTDMQPIFMALASVAQGYTTFIETIFENRFKHTQQLKKFGALVDLINEKTAIVKGQPELHNANVVATDLRGGAGAIIAALAAPGKSSISNVKFIDRGYEAIEKQLTNLGASIVRKSFTNNKLTC